jgi:DegV family protein with EDD domain
MMSLHIVIDSSARFSNPRLIEQYPITVVPYKLDIGGKHHREGIDISDDEALRLIKSQTKPPTVVAPSVDEYAETFTRLSRMYDKLISIHTSREITQSWYNARQAAQQVSDFCEVAVIDSRSICAGQGMLARLAVEAVQAGDTFEQVVNKVRRAVERLYAVYYVETLDYLYHNQIMTDARSILGTMLKIKPVVSIEDGEPVITEKVRTHTQAVDRLVEFLSEFEALKDAIIIQNRTHITEQTRQLQDRLALEFPGRHFPYGMYGATLGALLGGSVTGVVILESEIEGFYDGEY